MAQTERLAQLLENLVLHFDLEELRTLCFDLGVDFDSLRGEGKEGKARELVALFDRSDHLPDLVAICARRRPKVDWSAILAAIQAAPPSERLPYLEPNADNQPTVGGDQIGRDKITIGTVGEGSAVAIGEQINISINRPSTWNRLRKRRVIFYPTLALIILLALVLLIAGLFVITGNVGVVQQQLQNWGWLRAFSSERQGETLIVIANFHHPAGVPDHEAHNEIKRAIEKAKAELGFASLRVEVEPTHLQADDRAGAEALAKRYNASIIIWGADTGVRVTVNFLNLKQPDFVAALVQVSETERTLVANPKAYNSFVTQDLPGQLTFLSLFAVGQSYYTQEQHEDSLKAIEKAVASLTAGTTVKGLAEAYFWLGWLYQEPMGNNDQAIANYDQALQLKPDWAEAYNNRGLAYYNKGDYDDAIADYDQALQLKPDYAVAYNNRGLAYYYKGNYDRAIADYDQAIKLKPDYADAYANRGAAYGHKGDTDRAIADFNQALQLKPDSALAYNNRGFANYSKGDPARAIADYDQALKLNPDYAKAYYNRGLAYRDKGDTARAIADFRRYLELRPNAPDRKDVEELIQKLEAQK